ncbi:MAG: thymidylate synthase [Panacagrimonas sp.]
MKQYLDLVQTVLETGSWQNNRTGVRSISLPGAMLRFDLQQGFPAVTTKKLAFRSAIGELVGFLRATRSAANFRALGCRVWDQNANANAAWLANPSRDGEDDLGPVYGVQWRQWPAYRLVNTGEPRAQAKIEAALARGFSRIGTVRGDHGQEQILLYKAIDQLRYCLDTIMSDPSSRRILFHGWNWAQLDEMALPPCHLLYQFLPEPTGKTLSLCLYIRSNDLGLGCPFNLTEGAALLHLVARLTGYQAKWFTYFVGDAHIYENHVEMLEEQLRREPLTAPQLLISDRIPAYAVTGKYEPDWLERIEPDDFTLKDYRHHPAITAPMAV